MELILASGSPRRHELLKGLGIDHKKIKATGEEVLREKDPGAAALDLARQKALEVSEKMGDGAVLGADTIVSYEGEILGKPRDAKEAFRMLKRLSGKTHTVYTGVSVVVKDKGKRREEGFFEATEVTFYALTDKEIHAYIVTGEPMDKAGGYGIQGRGAVLVKKIEGDYFNVVGLPLAKTFRMLKALGVVEREV